MNYLDLTIEEIHKALLEGKTNPLELTKEKNFQNFLSLKTIISLAFLMLLKITIQLKVMKQLQVVIF